MKELLLSALAVPPGWLITGAVWSTAVKCNTITPASFNHTDGERAVCLCVCVCLHAHACACVCVVLAGRRAKVRETLGVWL